MLYSDNLKPLRISIKQASQSILLQEPQGRLSAESNELNVQYNPTAHKMLNVRYNFWRHC